VTICHRGKNTISISLRAWPAHQRHGDTQGACAAATMQEDHGNWKAGTNANGKGHP